MRYFFVSVVHSAFLGLQFTNLYSSYDYFPSLEQLKKDIAETLKKSDITVLSICELSKKDFDTFQGTDK